MRYFISGTDQGIGGTRSTTLRASSRTASHEGPRLSRYQPTRCPLQAYARAMRCPRLAYARDTRCPLLSLSGIGLGACYAMSGTGGAWCILISPKRGETDTYVLVVLKAVLSCI
eukprot:3825035-Rhodomonas_salina.1